MEINQSTKTEILQLEGIVNETIDDLQGIREKKENSQAEYDSLKGQTGTVRNYLLSMVPGTAGNSISRELRAYRGAEAAAEKKLQEAKGSLEQAAVSYLRINDPLFYTLSNELAAAKHRRERAEAATKTPMVLNSFSLDISTPVIDNKIMGEYVAAEKHYQAVHMRVTERVQSFIERCRD